MLITYDGIALPYSENSKVSQEVVYDDLSRTDAVATKFVVETTFVINKNYLVMMAPTIYQNTTEDTFNELTAADVMNALGYRLKRVRRALSIKFGTTEMIPSNSAFGAGTVDAVNGPKPINFNFTQLTTETFLCDFKIEATYVDTRRVSIGDDAKTLTEQVHASRVALYNRWEESVSIDDCQYAKRTRKGRLAIRSDNAEGLTADRFREQLCVVSIPEGFIRESSDYVVSPDGLTLEYTIVDREVYQMPPFGAYKAEGYYKELGKGFNAALRFADCRVKLYGDKRSDKAALMLTAMRIVADKLKQVGAELVRGKNNSYKVNGESRGIAQDVEMHYDLYENIVEYRVMARFVGNKRRIKGVAGFRKTGPAPPTGSVQPRYQVRGTSRLLLQAAAYWDPLLQKPRLGKDEMRFPIDFPVQTEDSKVNIEDKLKPGEAGRFQED